MRSFLVNLLVLAAITVVTSASAAEPVREAPLALAPFENGIGKLIPNIQTKTIDGKAFALADYAKKHKAIVVAMTSTSCPLCKKYLPTLAELEKAYAEQGIGFVFVNSLTIAKADEMKEAAAKVKGLYLHDATGAISAQLGATSTTQVFLLDTQRTTIYRGAVDDQYGLGYSLDAPKKMFLKPAIDSHLAGKTPDVPATSAPGCVIELPKELKQEAVAVTYHNSISRLVQSHCIECHRKGGVGPFSLETRDDILAHKGIIKKVITNGTMPPWGAVKAKPDDHSPFINDRSLSEATRKELIAWMNAGGPEGDKADAPIARTFPKDWAIGKPDLVLQIPKPIAVKATGTMPYQKVVVETNFAEDKYIQAIEIRPTAKQVVHHVLVFPLGPGTTVPRGAEATGHVAAYVPGNNRQIYPDGYAKKLMKGGRLLFQIHYTPNGEATEDQTEIAFIFAKEKPHTEIRVFGLVQPKILIPPGDDNYKNNASLSVPIDVTICAFAPHMHVRGKACKYEIVSKDKKTRRVLLDIPQYDFNWQIYYQLAEPVVLKGGETLEFTAWFDNSDKNPANPDSKATVKWGPQTSDEMLIGYVEYYLGSTKK